MRHAPPTWRRNMVMLPGCLPGGSCGPASPPLAWIPATSERAQPPPRSRWLERWRRRASRKAARCRRISTKPWSEAPQFTYHPPFPFLSSPLRTVAGKCNGLFCKPLTNFWEDLKAAPSSSKQTQTVDDWGESWHRKIADFGCYDFAVCRDRVFPGASS